MGAKTIEINQAEYLVRGLGYIENLEDLEQAVVAVQDNVPVRIQDVAVVSLGPAIRRGVLDKDGAEVVGGVVVARYGSNPMQVIENVKQKIAEIAPGLPTKTLSDGTVSQLTIVPFYDRSHLIQETLGTLQEAISLQILITILVVVIMVLNLRASLLISSLLPIAVLMVFIAMRYFGVDANIVALSGIAIAIGTMVDLGVILSENVLKKLEEHNLTTNPEKEEKGIESKKSYFERVKQAVFEGSAEVSSAILTAVATTIVSFIPVFTLEAAEGKLFRPLAFTKTFALVAAVFVALIVLPALAHWFFGLKLPENKQLKKWLNLGMLVLGLLILILGEVWAAVIIWAFAGFALLKIFKPQLFHKPTKDSNRKIDWRLWQYRLLNNAALIIVVLAVSWLLAGYWLPLGAGVSGFGNFIFVALILVIILGGFLLLESYYKSILIWCLNYKKTFLTIPSLLIILGLVIWLGFSNVFGFMAKGFDLVGWNIRTTGPWSTMVHAFPGIGEEFMPALDEGSFLLMPTSMPHSGLQYNRNVLAQLDMLVTNIPEVEMVVGKLGRAESALDPAPISMYENIINYKSEYIVNEKGFRQRFKVNLDDEFILNTGDTLTNTEALAAGVGKDELVPDDNGNYFRNWREHIQSPDDIWQEIVAVTKIPGVTSAPKLQPIETRLVMLQTGMRAPMGIKVYGPNLETIEDFGMQLENILKEVPSVKSEAVFADRIVGKPYLHLNINRPEISRFGLNVEDVQQTIETAIGGMKITTTVEGRERFPVRVRYPRELRDDPESLKNILVPTPTGAQIPLGQLVDFEYVRGPQMIKSEETFLVGYVLFDKGAGFSEVEVVNDAQNAIEDAIASGELEVPAGISYKFSGSYENQIRAAQRLSIIVPVVLIIVFLILYFQFRSVTTSLMIFMGIAMAFSGGFILLWLYGQDWFLNFEIMGASMRDIFQIHTVNLSVAVWVGFIALFGIATDDGVLMGTYLDQSFDRNKTNSLQGIRHAVIEAGQKRIKPAVMTSATTLIALLPILTSTGRGSDIMIPMAIPAFGGMVVAAITYFIVPVLYSWREERRLGEKGINNEGMNI